MLYPVGENAQLWHTRGTVSVILVYGACNDVVMLWVQHAQQCLADRYISRNGCV